MRKTYDLDSSAGAGIVRLVVLIGMFTLTCMTLAQSGGPYEVTWTTIDGGGQTSAGGPYTATGTIGQPDAGAMTGGSFQVLGGFWPSAHVDTDGDGYPDGQDNCPDMYNPAQADRNLDGWGDLCECAAANLDGNASVDLGDFSLVLSDWLGSGAGLAGDINSDDTVDWRDIEILAYYWLSGCQF